ncbi:MAG: restriction endonuclease subunit S [Sulfuritalea sp.]|nr:restriction endonuclease subunit S [Sulfuritalea sp.]
MTFRKRLRIGEICKIHGGKPAPSDDGAFDPSGIPFVRMKDLGRYHHTTNLTKTDDCISGFWASKNGYRPIPTGCILLPRSGSVGLNHRAILGVDAIIVSHLCALEVIDKSIIDVQFLYRYLCSINFDRITKKTTGLDAINFSDLAEVEIPLPSIDEQRRIALALDRADSICNKRREAIHLTDEFLRSAYLTTVKVALGVGAPPVSLLDICNITTGKLDSNAAEDDGKYPFFTCAQETSKINSYAFDCEALLLAGNNASGDYSIKHYKGKFNAYQRTYVLSLKNQGYSYGFFRYAIQSKLRDLKRMSKGTNTKYLTLGILAEQMLVVPDQTSQQKFADVYLKVERHKLQMERHLKMSGELYSSLATRAFSGQL